jgi:hypothetical protein
MAIVRFVPQRRRVFVVLLGSYRIDGRPFRRYFGQLGSLPRDQPISAAARVAFWARFDAKWHAIVDRHPLVAPDDRGHVMATIAKRIGWPSSPAEQRAVRAAKIRLAAVAALDDLETDIEGTLTNVPMTQDEAEALLDDADDEAASIVREANARLHAMRMKPP